MKRYTEAEMMEFANYAKNWQSPMKVDKAFRKWQEKFPEKGIDDGYYVGVDMAKEGAVYQGLDIGWPPAFPQDRVEGEKGGTLPPPPGRSIHFRLP